MGLALVSALGAACGGDHERAPPAPVDAQGGAAGEDAGAGGSAGCAAGCAGAGGASAGGSGGAGGASNAGAGGAPPLLVISEISLSQAIKVPLMAGGAALSEGTVPIVSGKEGMLRVFVEPGSGFLRRDVVATLELSPGGVFTESRKFIAGPSSDEDTRTSFNFPLDGEAVESGMSYSVELSEPEGDALGGARFPAAGAQPIVSQSSNGNIRVVIVPLVVGGFVPDTGPTVMDRFRRRLRSMYPVPDAEVTVRAPLTLGYLIPPDGDEWDAALDDLYDLRAADNAPSDVFYYGLMTPAPTYDDFCVGGCTIGLAVLNDGNEVQYQGAIGLGIFSDGSGVQDAPDTIAHEIGHSLGRDHSPCGVAPSDTGPFPYPDGSVGAWGFDMDVRRPIDPDAYFDIMGYCVPAWISDFNYRALFERISLVNGPPLPLLDVVEETRYRVIVVRADGSLRWGHETLRQTRPRGIPEPVTLVDAGGNEVLELTGYFYELDHRSGGFVLVEADALGSVRGISAVRLDRRGRAGLGL